MFHKHLGIANQVHILTQYFHEYGRKEDTFVKHGGVIPVLYFFRLY